MRRSGPAIALILVIGSCTPHGSSPAVEPEPEPEPVAPIEVEPAATVAEPLPDRMGPMEIKQGIDQLTDGVLACGEQFELSSGTKIKIRFSIEGSSGSVAQAELLEPVGPELVACVEQSIAAVGPGVFPRFAERAQGFQFNFVAR